MNDPGAPVDLNKISVGSGYTFSVHPQESPEELAHRLEIEREERLQQLAIEREERAHSRRVFWAFSSVLAIVMLLSFLIVLGVVNPGSGDSGQAVEWSRTIISAIIAGLAGYLLPRSHK